MLSTQRLELPWEAQLAHFQNTLVLHCLRSRLPHFKIEQVVQLKTLRDSAVMTLQMIQMLVHKLLLWHQRPEVLAHLAKSASVVDH